MVLGSAPPGLTKDDVDVGGAGEGEELQTTGATAFASWRKTRRRFATSFPPSGARDHPILARSSVGRERRVAAGTASSAATLGQIRLAMREERAGAP